jgi:predicted RNase H-like HicB family nuclease
MENRRGKVEGFLMKLIIECEQEEDGRWLAEVIDLPGVLVYAQTPEEAVARVQALALRVLADRLEHGESLSGLMDISFSTAAAA